MEVVSISMSFKTGAYKWRASDTQDGAMQVNMFDITLSEYSYRKSPVDRCCSTDDRLGARMHL